MQKLVYISSLCLLLFSITGCNQATKISKNNNEEGIRSASLQEAGIDSALINKIDTAVSNGTFPNIHSLLIAQNNQLVYEKYWTGKDEKWGVDIGVTKHDKDSLHDIRSISKSIVSACFGILMQQGKIKSVHQKVFEFFPEYAKQDTGLKSMLTIEHLLTMSSGIKWNEEVPYSNPENSEVKMIQSGRPVECF